MSTHTPSAADPMRVGFLGLGHMGEPMAANLLRARGDLVVWNRSPAAAQRLRARGARVLATPTRVFGSCDTVILMLANLDAINETLGRTAGSFTVPVRGRAIINMGTIAPADSAKDCTRLSDCCARPPDPWKNTSNGRGPAGTAAR